MLSAPVALFLVNFVMIALISISDIVHDGQYGSQNSGNALGTVRYRVNGVIQSHTPTVMVLTLIILVQTVWT